MTNTPEGNSNRRKHRRTSTEATESSTGADDAGGSPEPELPEPHPDRSVENALKTQLAALRSNDEPYTNAGIKTAFNFASPAFRREVGGSLDEFVKHMTGPIHQMLIDHREAERGRLQVEDGVATEKVVVTQSDGDKTTYEFTLIEVAEGKYRGCWMTDRIELVYVGESPNHQHMPNVEFDGVEIKCKEGEILRNVLLRASGVSPYNQAAQYANCNGKGLCGTCAVEVVEGRVTDPTAQERRRMRLPPHAGNDNEDFRLSCQSRVLSDLVVHKHEGTWGQHIEEYAKGTDEHPGEPIRVSDDEYRGDDQPASPRDELERGTDGENLDLSDEARKLLAETEAMLDEDGGRNGPPEDSG